MIAEAPCHPRPRLSDFDLAFFLAGIAGAVIAGLQCWWAGAVVWFVFGNFLLFSHVFRIPVVIQVLWAAVFTLLTALTVVTRQPGWTATFAFSFALAVAFIVLTAKSGATEWLGPGAFHAAVAAPRAARDLTAPAWPASGAALPAEDGLQRLPFADALRGYAILAVIMVHSALLVHPDSGPLRQFMLFGVRGVQLFFVASAVTLCLSWERRAPGESAPVRNFFVRRFFRIAPMFYAAILLYLLLYGLAPRLMGLNSVRWWHVLLTALFVHGVSPESVNSVVPGGWSVAVELGFYAILPFLLATLRSTWSYFGFFVASIAVSQLSVFGLHELLSRIYPASETYLVSAFLRKNLLAQLPVFAAGMLAYRVLREREWSRRTAVAAILLIAPLLHMEALVTGRSAGLLLSDRLHAGAVFAVLALLLALFPPRLIVNSWIAALGRISYSMYLLHFVVLDFRERLLPLPDGNLPSIFHFLFVVSLTAVLASLAHRYVELPGIALGRRLIGRWEDRGPRLKS